MKIEDVVIIGAGPAGISAAIQLRRYDIEPLIFEKDRIGGLLKNADIVENYPGFPKGISGRGLITMLEEHIGKSDKVCFEDVIELDFENNLFSIISTGRTIQSRIAIAASGTTPVIFDDIPIPDDLSGRIFYEIYLLLKEKGKKIAIVGAGDAAFDYALNLGKTNEIVILNRSDRIKSLPLLFKRAEAVENIQYIEKAVIQELGPGRGNQISVTYLHNGKETKLSAHYLVFAIGRKPAVDFFSDRLRDNRNRLEKEGYFHIIGDVNNGLYRQTAIAVGDGIKAAMKTAAKLKEIR